MADLVTSFSSINDWDLEAIIRGWGGGGGESSAYSIKESPPPAGWYGPDPPQLGLGVEVFDVDQLEATATVLNELEELYKPFLLHHQPMCTDSPTKTTSSSSSSSATSFHALFDPRIDKGGDAENLEEKEMKMHSVVDGDTRAKTPCKRRKNKQKTRVVYRGAGDEEDNLAEMDQWNWRKYGQKSIKGSPYPRSYYRCSTVGGCQARKQVEQSKEEPYAYAVTYMGDHSHPLPTRRRTLAGRKLAKFS